MQREPQQREWRQWTGRILPVFAVALLALGPAQAKDKKKKHRDAAVPTQVEPAQRVSIDHVIEQVQRRYKAKVIDRKESKLGQQYIYVLKVLSEDGEVRTVRVDAGSGREI